MSRLKVLADGKTASAKNNARGKLFEKLMADVLRFHGYEIGVITSVNYAGMEIDIEGKLRMVDVPLYAECKCYENEIDCPKFQAFVGKYMTLRMSSEQAHGLFVAIPGLNSHAIGFYKQHFEGKTNPLIKVLDESHVLEAIFESGRACRPDAVTSAIGSKQGTAGDNFLLYTEHGYFWVQLVIPVGGGIANTYAIFDSSARLVTERTTIDIVTGLYPELAGFTAMMSDDICQMATPLVQTQDEEIVEVRGSSACFEYQFPASPQFFVGREDVLKEVSEVCSDIICKKTSCRGILFEAHSGFGKSSAVLAAVSHLNSQNHFAIAVDSRSASSSQFILRVVEHVQQRFGNFDGLVPLNAASVSGFDGAANILLQIGAHLSKEGRLLVIFLDQFENVFFLPDALTRISALLLKLCDNQSNVVLGFSWKTDLISVTTDFPYQQRDTLMALSRKVVIGAFSETETSALLERLRIELKAKLRKDLLFLLSEYSQGYPWLLKKLCAHVKSQREAGMQQLEIADRLLNVEELFQEDLRGLSSEEEDTLRRIAKLAPIGIQDLGDDFKTAVVQSLVNRRLVVRIGSKYDIYWDIFRDYLNRGIVPIQENYILRAQIGTVIKTAKLLASQSPLDLKSFQKQAGLNQGSVYNAARDLKLLGIARLNGDEIALQVDLPKSDPAFDSAMRAHLRDKLPKNRLVSRILEQLLHSERLTTEQVGIYLAEWCPYISATAETWQLYARIIGSWMNAADLAEVDRKTGTLSAFKPGQLRDRKLVISRRKSGSGFISIQVKPVETVMFRLADAIRNSKTLDRSGLGKTTLMKAMYMLEEFDFITRENGKITVRQPVLEYSLIPGRRQNILATAALKLGAFAKFVEILKANEHNVLTVGELGRALSDATDSDWVDITCETHAKIMLNWARYTGLAPESYSVVLRGRKKKS